ncbi:MAG: cysteine--tRNA ligase [Parcubacteria group bacterium]|nr:cysteine--tRNA ligase [Parcubacteria group bacterium]
MPKVYKSLTRKKEELKPGQDKKLRLFVCGPTVYDWSHIGHARTYIVFDAMVRYWRSLGFDVFYLQNITDIDDKIIQRAQEQGQDPLTLADTFAEYYFEDMDALGIRSVSKYAKATDYIQEIISQVQRLEKQGYVYVIEDGVYYDVTKFKGYGKLSGRTSEGAEDALSRIDESVQKKHKGDFALWKFSPPTGGEEEPAWTSPWGNGRPGWHIEDTAITEKEFGEQYDIHGGARDLLFPHHEAEIAQMEALSGKEPLVRYWLHAGFLTVEGEKMSKSLGNFITIREFVKERSARTMRLLILGCHYRSPVDYSSVLVQQTEQDLKRIDEFIWKLESAEGAGTGNAWQKLLQESDKEFWAALEDDFNTPKAIASLFNLIRSVNPLLSNNELGKEGAEAILKFLGKADEIFGFLFWGRGEIKEAPAEIQTLLEEREKARKSNNWNKADELRDRILEAGWQIDDTSDGPRLKKK